MPYMLDTPYKGARHYIHGTDLFNAIQVAANGALGCSGAYISSLSISRFAYHLCELCLEDVEDIPSKMGIGELTLPDGQLKKFWLRESPEKPSERKPYDEDTMVAAATFHEQNVTLTAPIDHTTIEAAIALTKVINYRLSPPKEGKWVFGKIDLNRSLPVVMDSITIMRSKSVPGRFSVNEILIDGHNVGCIQFIVGKP